MLQRGQSAHEVVLCRRHCDQDERWRTIGMSGRDGESPGRDPERNLSLHTFLPQKIDVALT